MSSIMSILAIPLGYIMKGCYMLVQNYGLALLLFTVLTRLIMMPLNIKQQKSTARLNMLQPEIEKLKKKYGKNQEKLNQETMKLYTEHNASPTSGCLPMIISFVVLWALIPVVYGPLTYVSSADKDDVSADSDMVKTIYTISSEVDTDDANMQTIIDKIIEDSDEELSDEQLATELEKVLTDSESYSNSADALEDLSGAQIDRIMNAFVEYEGLDEFVTNTDNFTSNMMKSSYGPEVLLFNFNSKADGQYLGVLSEDVQEAIKDFDYTFFGMELGKIPTTKDATVVIPFISFALQLTTMIISQIFTRRRNPEQKMNGTMMIMMFGMPLISLWIGFEFPCALGIYWIYSSAYSVFQTIFLNVRYSPARMEAIIAKEEASGKAAKKKKKKGPSMMERALQMQNEQNAANGKTQSGKSTSDDDGDEEEEDDISKLSKAQIKERNRQKLNEARKRYAEKYGDVYNDDDE
ncbi:MAG: YidC/Oxa1 family membrane protein insertase [Ruminococcus sp.]|nr:YidC/Oxa1 family membrane protein insertase [Ruminococcus sp.]